MISNCVINLAADKAAVARETTRVLRPGGRPTHRVREDASSAIIRARKPAA